MSFLCDDSVEYGTPEFTNQLQNLADRSGWVPYENIHQASVEIFTEKYGDGPLVLAQFLEMVVNPESSSEQVMAGWYLLYFSFKKKRADLFARGCDVEGQNQILRETYTQIRDRHEFAFYQIEYFFNKIAVSCNNYNSTTAKSALLP